MVEGEGHRRIVMVTHDDGTHLRAVLTTNMIDSATDFDVIVRGVYPCALLIHAELYGVLWHRQVREIVGQVPIETARSCRLALGTDGESVEHLEHGLPLGGVLDPRRRFKENELVEWQRIVGDCTRTLLDW